MDLGVQTFCTFRPWYMQLLATALLLGALAMALSLIIGIKRRVVTPRPAADPIHRSLHATVLVIAICFAVGATVSWVVDRSQIERQELALRRDLSSFQQESFRQVKTDWILAACVALLCGASFVSWPSDQRNRSDAA